MTKPTAGLIDRTDFEDLTWNDWKKTAVNQPGEITSRNGNYCLSFSTSEILNTTLTKSWTLRPDKLYVLFFLFQTPHEKSHYSVKWNDRDLEIKKPIPVGSTWVTESVGFKTSPIGFPPEDTIELTIERGTADNLVLLDDLELYDLDQFNTHQARLASTKPAATRF